MNFKFAADKVGHFSLESLVDLHSPHISICLRGFSIANPRPRPGLCRRKNADFILSEQNPVSSRTATNHHFAHNCALFASGTLFAHVDLVASLKRIDSLLLPGEIIYMLLQRCLCDFHSSILHFCGHKQCIAVCGLRSMENLSSLFASQTVNLTGVVSKL